MAYSSMRRGSHDVSPPPPPLVQSSDIKSRADSIQEMHRWSEAARGAAKSNNKSEREAVLKRFLFDSEMYNEQDPRTLWFCLYIPALDYVKSLSDRRVYGEEQTSACERFLVATSSKAAIDLNTIAQRTSQIREMFNGLDPEVLMFVIMKQHVDKWIAINRPYVIESFLANDDDDDDDDCVNV